MRAGVSVIAILLLTVITAAAPASADEDPLALLRSLSGSLVSWWPGEGNGYDLVGPNQGRLLGDVKFVVGRSGLAFSFDGDGAYVDCGNDASLRPSKSFTVSLWHRDGEQTRLAPHLISNAEGNTRGYLIYMNRKETKNWTFFVGSGASKAENGYAWLFAKDTPPGWEHLVATFDGSTMKLYQNGRLVASRPWTNFAAGNTHFYIGGWPEAADFQADRFFKGEIDDVMLFNRDLSADEVAALYHADERYATANPPDENEVVVLAKALEGDHAPRAWYAIHRLPLAGDRAAEAVAALAQPGTIDTKRVADLLGDLDAQDVKDRDTATQRLMQIGSPGAADLREAMKADDLSPEAKARAALVLKKLEDGGPTGDALPRIRAARVLEQIGTARALELLDRLAGGADAAPETKAAEAAAERIRKSGPAPATH